MTVLRPLTAAFDQPYIALALTNAGLKVSVRKWAYGLSVKVLDGDRQIAVDTLNAEGYRHSNGQLFSKFATYDAVINVRGAIQ